MAKAKGRITPPSKPAKTNKPDGDAPKPPFGKKGKPMKGKKY